MSLHEAYAATGDSAIKAARDRLIDFFIRVQARSSSPNVSRLNGTWFRAFDVEKWEYWGSTNDVAYGPWETENGWTLGWASATMSLAKMESSFWDASAPFAKYLHERPEIVMAACLDFLPQHLCVVS